MNKVTGYEMETVGTNNEAMLSRKVTRGSKKPVSLKELTYSSREQKAQMENAFKGNGFDIKKPVQKVILAAVIASSLGGFAHSGSAEVFIKEYTYQLPEQPNIDKIAADHGVTAQEILDWNQISSLKGVQEILLPKVKTMEVYADVLNIRSKPFISSESLGKLYEGDTVKVAFVDEEWVGILIKGRVCFVKGAYLGEVKTSEPVVTPSPVKVEAKKMYVTASTTLNVRSQPINGSVIGSLKKGTEVSVIAIKNNWAQIQFDGKKAYVSADYLTDKKPNGSTQTSPAQPTKKMEVIASSLNVRTKDSFNGSVVGSLKGGTEVAVKKIQAGWAEIEYKGKKAFVSAAYLKDIK